MSFSRPGRHLSTRASIANATSKLVKRTEASLDVDAMRAVQRSAGIAIYSWKDQTTETVPINRRSVSFSLRRYQQASRACLAPSGCIPCSLCRADGCYFHETSILRRVCEKCSRARPAEGTSEKMRNRLPERDGGSMSLLTGNTWFTSTQHYRSFSTTPLARHRHKFPFQVDILD